MRLLTDSGMAERMQKLQVLQGTRVLYSIAIFRELWRKKG